MSEDLILIALIRRPHGIRGELSADSYTFDNRRFKKGSRVFARFKNDKEIHELTIGSCRETPKGILLTFNEITDRTEADKYVMAEILIPESERLPLQDGRAYYDEYPGMKLVDADSNEELGTIRSLLELSSGNILSVRLTDGKERLITMAGEEIKRVDRSARVVYAKLLEELN